MKYDLRLVREKDPLAGRYIASKLFPLPEKVDLRNQCPPVDDQGQEGSCSANAGAGAFEYLNLQKGISFFRVSRNFLYWVTRAFEHDVDQDAGALTMRDVCRVLQEKGICKEDLWPYGQETLYPEPPHTCWGDAYSRKISAYFQLGTEYELKYCLASEMPFIFGFSVYQSFETQTMASTGIMQMPVDGEQILGGHAVMAVGYDDATQMYLVRNSWGTTWGQAGYFWMPYDFMHNPNYANDFYTIR